MPTKLSSIRIWLILALFWGVLAIFSPVQAAAAVCASNTTIGAFNDGFGNGSTYAEGTRFSISSDCYVTDISGRIGVNAGSPSDQVLYRIYSDNSGVPDTVLFSSDPFSVPTGAIYNASVSGAPLLTSGTYWFVPYRTGAQDGANYYTTNLNHDFVGNMATYNGSTWSGFSGYTGYFVINGGSAPPSVVTRIDTVTPADKAIVASTSPTVTFGATGYVNAHDYVSGMYILISYSSNSYTQAAVASPEFTNTFITLPVTAAGAFSLSTTTASSTLRTYGVYNMQTQLRTPSITNSILNFFGFGQFANLGIKTATSTTFTYSAASQYDVVTQQVLDSVQSYLASSTVSLASCTNWTAFNLQDCTNLLFVPQFGPIKTAMDTFKNQFLSYMPWGYATRFLVILSGSATTSLPSFTVYFPIGANNNVSTTSLNFDMQDMVAGGAALIDSVHTNDGSNLSMRDIAEPWIQLIIALTVILIIIKDLWGVSNEARHNFNSHNGRE